ncbi:MAG TPA: L,D-transpeptidase family protein [Blastocatellia bacterium]|nr:L,D-transpeptidase family protein [Blastocatellia bacterium]
MNILHFNALFVSSLLVSLMIIATTQSSPARQRDQARRGASPEERYRILVKKGERKLYLYVWENGKERLAKTYQIALGNNPTGSKFRQGDGATPEGEYYITHKNARSKFYLSLGVSYPNITDADKGLKEGLITKVEHQAIVGAIRAKTKPPQNTRLGGDIFIHGGGTGKLFGSVRDWTLGCVALENEEIKELFEMIPLKTQVKIVP